MINLLQICKMNIYLHSLLSRNDSLAQLVEHLPFKEVVLGSSPRRITERAITCSGSFLCQINYFSELAYQSHMSLERVVHICRLGSHRNLPDVYIVRCKVSINRTIPPYVYML